MKKKENCTIKGQQQERLERKKPRQPIEKHCKNTAKIKRNDKSKT
jgi:hypothetical protein